MPGARVSTGERVTLRTVEEEDVGFVQRALANPELRYPIGNPVLSRDEVADLRDEGDADRLLVCVERGGAGAVGGGGSEQVEAGDSGGVEGGDSEQVRDDGPGATDRPPGPVDGDDVTRVGTVDVADADHKRPELGYWIAPEFQGEGYGAEAVSLAVDYAFAQYDVPAVAAKAFAHNEASRGLLESLGFTAEGRLRKFMFVDGAHRDMVVYGLLREEWTAGE